MQETDKSLQQERLRGSTKHTMKFQHDKDKEKILKGFFFGGGGGRWAGFGVEQAVNDHNAVQGFPVDHSGCLTEDGTQNAHLTQCGKY